jgi:hypothetical protein
MGAEMGFSTDELSAIISALYAYQFETHHYLESCDIRDRGHDDCCTVALARKANRDAERASLESRLEAINSALSRCGAT